MNDLKKQFTKDKNLSFDNIPIKMQNGVHLEYINWLEKRIGENYYLELVSLHSTQTTEFKKEVRELIANYIQSEGCTCCQNIEEHTKAKWRLGELLECGKYNDEDVHNFYQYATNN